jgi:hypothetical protein
MGTKKAAVAIAHKILVAVFRDNQKVCSATISDTPISGILFL